MDDDLYNSASVCATLNDRFSGQGRSGEIIDAVDDFARGASGCSVTRSMLNYGARRIVRERDRLAKQWRKEAASHVRRKLYGSGIVSMLAWMLIKPLVMRIIEAFLDQLFSA